MAILVILSMLIVSPLAAAAPLTVQSDDFGIITDLHRALDEQADRAERGRAAELAEENLTLVRDQRRQSGAGDPLGLLPDPANAWRVGVTDPPPESHPVAYDLLLDPSTRPPAWPNNLLTTVLDFDGYSAWIDYESSTGRIHQTYEEASMLGEIFSLDPSVGREEVDIDGDGDDDISIVLSISFLTSLNPFDIADDQGTTWDIEGSQIWIKPDVRYRVRVLDESDNMWDNFGRLNVTIMKVFSYSFNLISGGDHSFLWVIDGRFAEPPTDWSFTLGIERIYFDLVDAALSVPQLILQIVGDDLATTFASIQAPYAISIENENNLCAPVWSPGDYDNWTNVDARIHMCRTAAGFGYMHFGPDVAGVRPVLEYAYIDATITPGPGEQDLPQAIDLVLRSDALGEDSFDSLELFTDRTSDMSIRYYENRTGMFDEGGRPGNVTDSVIILRGLPAEVFTEREMERIFCMIGNSPAASTGGLPGQLPNRLTAVLLIKNMTRDVTPNSQDCEMPVDPTDPPDTVIAFLAKERLSRIEYDSWMWREGRRTDHMHSAARIDDLPPGLLVTGTFTMPAGTAERVGGTTNLDAFSALLDNAMLAIVDLILDVGRVMNDVPLTLLDLSASEGDGDMSISVVEDVFFLPRPGAAGAISIDMGSGPHPIGEGDHIILSVDPELDGWGVHEQPVLPVAMSLAFDGFTGLDLAYDNINETRHINISAAGGDRLQIGWAEHVRGDFANASVQVLELSNLPSDMRITSDPARVEWRADSRIGEFIYSASAGAQHNALVLAGIPADIDLLVGDILGFSASESIGSISAQVANDSSPETMDGDHFLFTINEDTGEAAMSARLSAVTAASWRSPEIPGATNASGLGEVRLDVPGTIPFNVLLDDESAHLDDPTAGLDVTMRLAPLPGGIRMEIPSNNNTTGLELPELSSSFGLVGIAGLLGDVIAIGKGLNDLLANMTRSFAGGTTTDDELSTSIELAATATFDLTVEATRGRLAETPPWVHGASLEAVETEAGRSLHTRAWLPSLPPDASISYHFDNRSGSPEWGIELDIKGWTPLLSDLQFIANGIEDRDGSLLLSGLRTDEPTDVRATIHLETDVDRAVPRQSVDLHYEILRPDGDPAPLESVHVTFLDGRAKQRIEALVLGVPGASDLTATIGDVLEINFAVPDGAGAGTDISSNALMLQMSREAVGRWWGATVYMRDLPTEVHLSTAPSSVFDITQPMFFQGTTQLDYISNGDEMDLYMFAEGRALDRRGDVLLVAEDLPARTRIAPTEDWGVSVASEGEGIRRLYLRLTDIPSQPGVTIRQIEVTGERLKSATVHVLENQGYYPIVIIEDVRGGGIVAIGKVDIEFAGIEFDGQGVLLDAQITSGVPTATSIGLNGIAADLGTLNVLTGGRSATTHIVAIEPISSAIATGVATIL